MPLCGFYKMIIVISKIDTHVQISGTYVLLEFKLYLTWSLRSKFGGRVSSPCIGHPCTLTHNRNIIIFEIFAR